VAEIIDGKAIAARVRADVKAEVERLRASGTTPALATVLVGDEPASKIYVGGKHRACEEVGVRSIGHELPASTTQEELLALVAELNRDPEVNGFIVQLPLPEQIDPAEVAGAIEPLKDVDGLTPTNAGLLVQGREALVPATPLGVMELLRSRGPRPSWSAEATSWADRSYRCSCTRTRPSRPATHVRATSPQFAAARRCWSRRSGDRA
jgi:methylenetetrahydrofolate dehydrogenase (NADP+)/methenyltetrahydrofolate cyclohydrolase